MKLIKLTANDISLFSNFPDLVISQDSILEDLLSNHTYYIGLVENNTIIAYLGTKYVCDTLDIIAIQTRKEFQNQHLANKLLESLFDFAKKNHITTLNLEVRSSNSIAIHLYENHQFEKIGIRKNYYSNPLEDAYFYQKKM